MEQAKKKRGTPAKPIIEHPTARYTLDQEPVDFPGALAAQLERHGDSAGHLGKALAHIGHHIDVKAIRAWTEGAKVPSTSNSFAVIAAIEHRYRLPVGYFRAKMETSPIARRGVNPAGVTRAERRRLAWHLPDDFDDRPAEERAEILDWVRKTFVSGATDYRRFQSEAIKEPYSIALDGARKRGKLPAPPRLIEEMDSLLSFKSSILTAPGQRRNGRWVAATADQKIEHFGLLFGALVADPDGANAGAGIPIECLSFAVLAVPAVWDWYLGWRERRRGFLTAWEIDLLNTAKGLVRAETGWIRQMSDLASRLVEIPNFVTKADIETARSDWSAFCDAMHVHATTRIAEVQGVSQIHRDPFEPVVSVLEADSPLSEYKKIADEILRNMPGARRHPKQLAEARRSLLMLRIGLHTGFRQKNLRQLLLCPLGNQPTTERRLAQLQRGEIRWRADIETWELFVPHTAFKNSKSSYFSAAPYKVALPNVAGLYNQIDLYVRDDRARLLAGATDPGTFFVKSASARTSSAEYDDQSFYVAWRQIIARYGVYNPYTGRGAIVGLLPHGPHNIRDVLATEVLKRTGSFERASYAIQDTPAVVAKHYGRFLPKDKAALAAEVLNQVWAEDDLA